MFRDQIVELYDGNRSHKEIAHLTGHSLGSVSSTISLLRQKGIITSSPHQTNEKVERNQEIHRRWMAGNTLASLAHEYDLSRSRVDQIVQKQERRKRIDAIINQNDKARRNEM